MAGASLELGGQSGGALGRQPCGGAARVERGLGATSECPAGPKAKARMGLPWPWGMVLRGEGGGAHA